MASKITKRLEIATQTTGAAQTERELAKVGQAAAAAGAAAEKGMDKMTSSADDAGGRLDGLKSKLAGSKEGFSALGASGFALASSLQATSGSTTQLLGGLGAVTGAMSSIPGPVGVVSAGLTALIGVGSSVVSMLDTQAETTDDGAEAWARYAQTVNAAREQLGDLADFASPARLRRIRELMGIRGSDSESLFSGDVGIPKLQAAVLKMEDELARRQAIAQAKGTAYNIDQVVAAQKQLDSLRETLGMAQKRASFAEDELAFASEQAALEAGRGKSEDTRAEKRERALSREKAMAKQTLADLLSTPLTPSLADTLGIGQNTTDTLTRQLDEAYTVEERYQQAVWKLRSDYQARASQLRKQEMEQEQARVNARVDAVQSEAAGYASIALSALLAGESIKEAIGKEAVAKSLMSAADALGWGAAGLFALATGNPAAAAAAAAAASQALAASAAYAAVGAALGGFSGGGGGGGGGGAASAPVSSESLTGPRESGGGGGDIVINANFQGQPLLTDRAVSEAVGRAVSEANRQRGNAIYGRLS